MSPPDDDKARMQDMLDHARLARAAAASRSRPDLDTDPVFRAACERFIEIIGEAASRVSDQTRDAHPDIPWRQIVGTRNILIHAYMTIDLDILWNIIDAELPGLITSLESLLS